jgi:hypothetical protein
LLSQRFELSAADVRPVPAIIFPLELADFRFAFGPRLEPRP